jgi:hypothetical protein
MQEDPVRLLAEEEEQVVEALPLLHLRTAASIMRAPSSIKLQ